jgi:hypothetical protein
MARRASIAARETVAVLRPQLSGTVLRSELLSVLHRINKVGTPTALEGRERLVRVFSNDRATALTLTAARHSTS